MSPRAYHAGIRKHVFLAADVYRAVMEGARDARPIGDLPSRSRTA